MNYTNNTDIIKHCVNKEKILLYFIRKDVQIERQGNVFTKNNYGKKQTI